MDVERPAGFLARYARRSWRYDGATLLPPVRPTILGTMISKRTPHDRAQELLANTVEKFDGCRIWQGAVDDRGYGYATVDGHKIRVARYVKLYHMKRSEEQVIRLKAFRVEPTCGRLVCIEPSHWEFKTGKPAKEFEELVEWWKQS